MIQDGAWDYKNAKEGARMALDMLQEEYVTCWRRRDFRDQSGHGATFQTKAETARL